MSTAAPRGPMPSAEILVGGQAVLEGVMMKMPRAWAVCVRRSNGEIVSREGEVVSWSQRWPVLKLPVLRGVAVLGQMMGLGMRCLYFSSDVAAEDAEKSDAQASSKVAAASKTLVTLANLLVLNAVAGGPDGTESDDEAKEARGEPVPPKPVKKGGLSGFEMALSIGLAAVIGIGVFKALPLWLARRLGQSYPAFANPVTEDIVSGVFLAVLFVGYLWAMSRFKDMRRVFQYHGAEHEVVHVHEKGLPWTVDAARAQPTEHPRCGTSFLFFVVLTSIAVFMLSSVVAWFAFGVKLGFVAKLGLRLALLPLIVGISFELIRLSSRHRTNPFFRALMAPGLWSQRITTKKPDDSMLDVSLRAFRLTADRSGVAEPART